MASLAKLIAVVALLAVATASALASVAQDNKQPSAQIRALGDNLSISNSKGTGAILTASNLAPGQQVTGNVTVGNSGNIPGTFTLNPSNLTDTPGPNGGNLSQALNLTITGTGGTLYNGKLANIGTIPLGVMNPSQSQSYVFTASLPDTGIPLSTTTGDNLYKGSTTSVTFNWTAIGEGNPDTGPTLPPPPDNTGGGPLKLAVGGRAQKVKKNSISLAVSCNTSCALRVNGVVSQQKKRKKPKTMFKTTVNAFSLANANGGKGTIKLRFNKKQVKKIKKALKQRNKVWATVTVTGSHAGGKPVNSTVKVKIKR